MENSSFDTNVKIGVLGGGQLGRMLHQSAINLNLNLRMMDGDKNAPCASLIEDFIVGDLEDYQAVYEFGKTCDILTIEIEKVNTEALAQLEKEGVKVYPQSDHIAMIQDKRLQKEFYKKNNIPTANFTLTDTLEAVKKYDGAFPVVHKVGKGGYDGRGVKVLKSKDDLTNSFSEPSLLEDFVPFAKELAVIVARNPSGQVSSFPTVEMVFHPEHNLVEYLLSPAMIDKSISKKAQSIAMDIIDKLELVGILAVEMFLTKEGEILVNEIAPRPHNSGHQSIEGNFISQYDAHLRAILDLPFSSGKTKTTSAMVNILGADGHTGNAKYVGIEEVMTIEGVQIHLYGKKITKPFRKMGHITICDPDLISLKAKIKKVKDTLKVIAS